MAVPKLADGGVRLGNRQHHVIGPPKQQDGDVKPEQLGKHEIPLSERGDLGAQRGQGRMKVIGEIELPGVARRARRVAQGSGCDTAMELTTCSLRGAKASFAKTGRKLAVSRKGQRTQGRMHVPSQSRARHEYETSDALREVHCGLDSGGSTEGATDYDDLARGAGIEKLSRGDRKAAGVGCSASRSLYPNPGRSGASTVEFVASAGSTQRQLTAVSPSACSSRTGEPEPARR